MKIPRVYEKLGKFLKPNKVLVIYGPRQVGKTTLVKNFLSTQKVKYRFETGDDIQIHEILGSQEKNKIVEYAQNYKLIVIDEAQKIKNIGIGLKLMVDHIPGIKIIATGSSSFELAGQIGEPLTGRKITLTLFPIAHSELKTIKNDYDLKKKHEEFLIYGMYPEVITAETKDEKRTFLNEIVGSYLLKDILEIEKVKNSKLLLDLLRLMAFQIGNEVSLSELGRQLGIDVKTVARYIDLLEKAFVLYNLRGFSRNLRKEVTKKSKYYFYDNGVRNALISNLNPLNLRNDVGMLWENFLVMERLKKQAYQKIDANNYFWRTWDQKEIDWIEEREGKLLGYEFKWKEQKVKKPKEWLETYPNSEFHTITTKNYLEFI